MAKDEDDLVYDYREGKEFQKYCDIVESCLTNEPQTFRALKERLGDRLIIGWFVEALEKLESDGRAQYNRGVIVDTVQIGTGEVKMFVTDMRIGITSANKTRPDLGLDN